jgi:serine protease Do
MSDNQLLEAIERYLNGDMSVDERKQFELVRKQDPEIDNKIAEHQQFIGLLKQYGERIELENRLNAIHSEIDVHALAEELTVRPGLIVQLWRNHHSKISVAASIAIFAVLITLYFTGSLSNQKSTYQELRLEVGKLNHSNEKIIKSIHDINSTVKKTGNHSVNYDRYRGTGFALTANGYIITNYHVIVDNDSVYVQNSAGEAFKSKVIYTDPQSDVAVLKIVDTAFKNLSAIPYTFKRTKSDLAEDVYTFGYPSDSGVFGSGYLTSSNGLNGDSLRYQVSIPVNPGNSGGPLLDSKGNVIGIIDAKQAQMEGAHFAIKSSYVLKALQNIPADSLTRKFSLNSKNTLAGLNRVQQLKKLKDYVFMVKVYN